LLRQIYGFVDLVRRHHRATHNQSNPYEKAKMNFHYREPVFPL
jgi:hypothetical protein